MLRKIENLVLCILLLLVMGILGNACNYRVLKRYFLNGLLQKSYNE